MVVVALREGAAGPLGTAATMRDDAAIHAERRATEFRRGLSHANAVATAPLAPDTGMS